MFHVSLCITEETGHAEFFSDKRGNPRKKIQTDSGKPWGKPIEWEHEKGIGKDPTKVPVKVPLKIEPLIRREKLPL